MSHAIICSVLLVFYFAIYLDQANVLMGIMQAKDKFKNSKRSRFWTKLQWWPIRIEPEPPG